jgi:hypothetical protein
MCSKTFNMKNSSRTFALCYKMVLVGPSSSCHWFLSLDESVYFNNSNWNVENTDQGRNVCTKTRQLIN